MKLRIHPYQWMLYFSMLASAVLFIVISLVLLVSLKSSDQTLTFEFPKYFTLSTIVLLLGHPMVQMVKAAYKDGKARKLKYALLGILVIILLFCVAQLMALKQVSVLIDSIDVQNHAAVVLILGSIHLIHIGVLIYLVFRVLFALSKAMEDKVAELVYFSQFYELTKIKLVNDFFLFLEIVWIAVFLLFFAVFK